MKQEVYIITYYRNGEFVMISNYYFTTKQSANNFAKEICKPRGDDSTWTYKIKQLQYCMD